ncbi:hypothetical protein [Ascidiaceihabitans sp.]|uniref:hypothetical protein n=1 Tax=Ascidiaceihabitans sp. TaxID=1872644 RepID=UPI00329680A1
MQNTSPLPRVEKTTFDGVTAWIKRPEATRSNGFTLLHSLLKPVMPPALHPTGALGGMDAIRQEAGRLDVFAQAGLPAPRVLELRSDCVILSDTGAQLRDTLHRLADDTQRLHLIERAMRGLGAVHAAKLCHGRPFLKDMTIGPDDQLSFLDLEENPTARMSLQDAQARDVWLLLLASTEFYIGPPPQTPLQGLTDLLDVYFAECGPGLTPQLRNLGRALRPYRRVMSVLRLKGVSKDAAGAYWSMRVLEQL